MQGIQPGEEYLDIVEKVGWLISLRISNRNRILKTHKTDCVSIAETYHSAIFHIALGNLKTSLLSMHPMHLLIFESHPGQSLRPIEQSVC